MRHEGVGGVDGHRGGAYGACDHQRHSLFDDGHCDRRQYNVPRHGQWRAEDGVTTGDSEMGGVIKGGRVATVGVASIDRTEDSVVAGSSNAGGRLRRG